MEFPKLFSPIEVGRVEIKNRIIFPPIATNLAYVSGEISDRQVFHYVRRARGGAGLIIVENACIDYPASRHGATQPRIDPAELVPSLARLARGVHDAGAKISIELTHPGLNASLTFNGGRRPVAPFPLSLRKDGVLPKELTLEEIDQLTDDDIARRLVHTRDLLGKAGAHYVIDGFGELLDVIDDINSSLKRGERP
jgi:2,4-dienoyl-CoA reductase-like NADH-dependent reductase (Old Yellow Enzyme family)